jgi:hypothetical protein
MTPPVLIVLSPLDGHLAVVALQEVLALQQSARRGEP